DECDPAGPDPGGVVTIGPVPPLPAPPPPPPSTSCNWGTVRSVAGNSNMGLMTAPTPAGDPAGAAAIRGNWWTSPSAAVYLSDLNGCSGGSTIDVSIGTTGTWGDPDVVEITFRRKSTRQPIGIRWY